MSKSRKSHQSSNNGKKYIKFQFDEKTVKVPRILNDRFVLQDILDRGGFGSIINAYDTKNENGKVATTPAIVKIVSDLVLIFLDNRRYNTETAKSSWFSI